MVAVEYPKDVGIKALEIYFPKRCVDQASLETFDDVSAGKYTVGLGQNKMGFCGNNEDINSICLTVLDSLLTKYNIDRNLIGRLEVGTETIIDKSKSVKSVLMQLFENHEDGNIEGIDTKNACYGGTAALFNAIDWIESSYWNGKLAIVIAADIAVYASGNARPTGGCGAVAMLIGPNAPLVFDRGLRVSYMQHVYDFYKPDLLSEYPTVNGMLSVECYLRSLDNCYKMFGDKVGADKYLIQEKYDYFVYHSPYTKLVQKSHARLAYNEYLQSKDTSKYPEDFDFKNTKLNETYFDKKIEKSFVDYTKQNFNSKVIPSLKVAKEVGNMYCGSLYGGLVSLISNCDNLNNKKIVMFSYGSGACSSMFSITVKGDCSTLKQKLDLDNRLKSRDIVQPEIFDEVMKLREQVHHKNDYIPSEKSNNLFKGSYYLEKIDKSHQRFYSKFN